MAKHGDTHNKKLPEAQRSKKLSAFGKMNSKELRKAKETDSNL